MEIIKPFTNISRISPAVVSVYGDATYEITIESNYPTTAVGVETLNAANNQLIDIKRLNIFPARVNVAPFARNLIKIEPVVPQAEEEAFCQMNERLATLRIRIGTVNSETVTLLPAHTIPTDNQSVIPLSPATGTLHTGEFSEHSFYLAEPATLSATATVTTLSGKQFSFQYTDFETVSGIVTFLLDTALIRSEALEAGFDPAECTFIELQLLNYETSIAEFSAKLLPTPTDALRLAWLNQRGGLSFHTFAHSSAPRIETTSRLLQSATSTRSELLKSTVKYELSSGYLTLSGLLNLSDILLSNQLWIVTDHTFTPARIEQHKQTDHSNDLHHISLTISKLQ